jgi:HEAT repeat protein
MVIRIPDLEPLMALQNVDVWKPLQNINLPDLDMMSFRIRQRRDGSGAPRVQPLGVPGRLGYRYSNLMGQGGDYSSGKNLLNQQKYDQAIVRFDKVIAQKAANADGAFYWKAYAQFKLGKADDAVNTIAALRKDYPQSRYLTDARVLEADAKRRSGQPINPAELGNDELKMLALNGIKNTDPERAIPLLEGVLTATNSLGVKKQALFILASMNNQPKAHQILVSYAKGAGNPDLQIEAIRFLAVNSDKQTTGADLMQIYQSSQDTDVKLAVISALGRSGDHVSLFNIAGSTGSPMVLRTSALNSLGGTIGPQELMTLYDKETNKESAAANRQFARLDGRDRPDRSRDTADRERPGRPARGDPALGRQPSAKTGQALVDLYGTTRTRTRERSVHRRPGESEQRRGLVAIARKEANLSLKTAIVRQLSEMAPKSKVAADYLMEIIK